MNNTLMAYLNKRLYPNDTRYLSAHTQTGPVICISREVGCGAVNIAKLLAAELDKQSQVKKWKVLSKEILQQSALELKDHFKLLRGILSQVKIAVGHIPSMTIPITPSGKEMITVSTLFTFPI
ncbi:MAG TPA: hypothetical protein VF373_09780 [Prolixibacteraceae bacterium]